MFDPDKVERFEAWKSEAGRLSNNTASAHSPGQQFVNDIPQPTWGAQAMSEGLPPNAEQPPTREE